MPVHFPHTYSQRMNGSQNSTNGNMERDVMDGAKFFEKRGDGGFNAGANFDDQVEVSLHVDWSQLSDTDCADPNKANLGTRTGMVYINATSFAAERYEGMWSPTNVTVSLTVDPCKLSESIPSVPANTFFASSADGSVSMLAEHASIEVSRQPNTTDTYLEVLPDMASSGRLSLSSHRPLIQFRLKPAPRSRSTSSFRMLRPTAQARSHPQLPQQTPPPLRPRARQRRSLARRGQPCSGQHYSWHIFGRLGQCRQRQYPQSHNLAYNQQDLADAGSGHAYVEMVAVGAGAGAGKGGRGAKRNDERADKLRATGKQACRTSERDMKYSRSHTPWPNSRRDGKDSKLRFMV